MKRFIGVCTLFIGCICLMLCYIKVLPVDAENRKGFGRKASDTNTSVQLEVPYISQEGLLTTGCELISTMMVLNFYGINADTYELLEYLSQSELIYTEDGEIIGRSPEETFIGSPWSDNGYGCFPPVIMDVLENVLTDGMTASDTSGIDLEQLSKQYLDEGIPVIVWATINMEESYPTTTWSVIEADGSVTGETYTWHSNEHCLVFVGYDEDDYYFNDPWESNGRVQYDKTLAQQRYEEMGSRSIAIE